MQLCQRGGGLWGFLFFCGDGNGGGGDMVVTLGGCGNMKGKKVLGMVERQVGGFFVK